MRVQNALDKGENPLPEEEIHFFQTCCQILKTEIDSRVMSNNITAVNTGKGDPFLTVKKIQRLLGALWAEAEITRDCDQLHIRPPEMQTICSLEHLNRELPQAWEDLQRGFIMGINMVGFNVTKSLEVYRITLNCANTQPFCCANNWFIFLCRFRIAQMMELNFLCLFLELAQSQTLKNYKMRALQNLAD